MAADTLPPIICGSETEFSLMLYEPDKQRPTGKLIDLGKHKPIYSSFEGHLPEGMHAWGQFRPDIALFTSNGGRLCVDVGGHLEWSTPECSSAEEVAVYEMAGEAMVLHALEELVRQGTLKRFRLNKRVTDGKEYWGAHENYRIPSSFDPKDADGVFVQAMAPHLATRAVLVGAGMVDSKGSFRLAQKLFDTDQLIGAGTTTHRPLIGTRDEPLEQSLHYQRLHLIQGDANVLPWSIAMKFGTTAAVIRMVEQGVDLSDLAIDAAHYVAKRVARDLSLMQPIKLANGKSIRPTELQSELAARAKYMSKRLELSEGEVRIIDEWQLACDDLETDHRERLFGLSDWVTRHAAVCEDQEQKPQSTPEKTVARARGVDLAFDQLGQLGDKPGPAAKLRAKFGPPSQVIEAAVVNPPQSTRARLRGAVVTKAATDPAFRSSVVSLDWEHVQIEGQPRFNLTATRTKHKVLESLLAKAT